MRFLELVGHIADVSAIPVALTGFGLTIWQLVKTRDAAESAKVAAKSAESAVVRNTFLVAVQQLHRLEEDLSNAIRGSHDEVAIYCLFSWKRQAGEVRGLLRVAGLATDELQSAIQSSIYEARVAIDALSRRQNSDLLSITNDARQAMAVVTMGLADVAGEEGMRSEVSASE